MLIVVSSESSTFRSRPEVIKMWSQPRQRQYDPRTCRQCEFRVKISGEKFSSQATLQRPRSHKWLVATILDSANIKHVHHGRKFDWTVLGANTSAGHHKTGQGEHGGLSLSGKGKQGLPRGVGVEGDSQGFAGERALGHLGGDQRAGAPQLPVCAARREQV